MKYAFMTWSTPTRDLNSTLDLAKRFGYDAVEWRIGRGKHYDYKTGQKHGVELNTSSDTRQQIRQTIADSSIISCCIATSCNYADPQKTAIHIDETHEAIDLAGDIDCPRLRVFGGPLPEGLARDKAITIVTDALKSLASHAAERKVTLCMETHDDWTHPEHVAAIIQGVDHPAVAVNWDFMHTLRQSKFSPDDAFTLLKPWIQHIHFHDGSTSLDKLEMCPIGQGDIDHRRPLELLKTINYDGYLSGEWINWQPEEEHLPRELATMKAYEAELQ